MWVKLENSCIIEILVQCHKELRQMLSACVDAEMSLKTHFIQYVKLNDTLSVAALDQKWTLATSDLRYPTRNVNKIKNLTPTKSLYSRHFDKDHLNC